MPTAQSDLIQSLQFSRTVLFPKHNWDNIAHPFTVLFHQAVPQFHCAEVTLCKVFSAHKDDSSTSVDGITDVLANTETGNKVLVVPKDAVALIPERRVDVTFDKFSVFISK